MMRLPGSGFGSWLTLAFLALVALMLAAGAGLSRVSGWIPLSVLSATLVLLLWQLAAELLAARLRQPRPPGSGTDARNRRATAVGGWIGLLLLLSWLLGVVAGSTLFSLAWLRWHAGERWPACLAQAAGLGLALWLVFGRFLGSGLYPGVLWPLLR
jgi:hypothetical protein